MTYLLDTSALLAQYLAEPGIDVVDALLENPSKPASTSILAMFEFELRLQRLRIDDLTRAATLNRYRALLSEVVNVDEAIREEAVRLRKNATARISAMDVLIAASASVRNATLVHRDPDFAAIPQSLLRRESLPPK